MKHLILRIVCTIEDSFRNVLILDAFDSRFRLFVSHEGVGFLGSWPTVHTPKGKLQSGDNIFVRSGFLSLCLPLAVEMLSRRPQAKMKSHSK